MVAFKWTWFLLCLIGHVLANEAHAEARAEGGVQAAAPVSSQPEAVAEPEAEPEAVAQEEVEEEYAEKRNVKKNPVDWVNLEFDRAVDLSGTGITEEIRLVIKNVGEQPTDQYHVLLPQSIFKKMSAFSASMVKQNEAGESEAGGFVNFRALSASLKQLDNMEVGFGILTLPEVIDVDGVVELRVVYKYNDCGVPSPKLIGLRDDQYLKYQFFRQPFSFYATESATLVIGGSEDIQEIAIKDLPEDFAGKKSANTIQFGKFSDIPRLTIDYPVTLRYLHNRALNEVVSLKRDIWISHWAGTLEFTEYYEYQNKGAGLIDNYSRLELMKDPQLVQKPTVRSYLEHRLPEGSTDQYTVDKVGKINTAQMSDNTYYVKPRFPIYGGWGYNYTVGWTNSLKDFLRINESNAESFILAAPVLNGPVDTAYDLVEYSIYLPEGAEFVEAKSPLPFVNLDVSSEKSYFDLKSGHVKVTFTFQNLVSEIADSKVLITYNYSKEAFYNKFLRISMYIFVALMSFFFLNVINLRVTRK